MARTIYGDHRRFIETYFKPYPGYYFTGDGAKRDAHGHIWITGRVDDVVNVSGHRLGTAEIESAIASSPHVAECAVVGFPHSVKGQGIYAFVVLKDGIAAGQPIHDELRKLVRTRIGPFAAIDVVHFASGLPKTRSGKILRRILRKIAAGDVADLGDTSTLSDPEIVGTLIAERKKAK